jgi:hypothetical protein
VSGPVSHPLQQFLRERLPSREQVEIVLLLRGELARSWTATDVAERLGTPYESTAMRLFLLASNGLLVHEAGTLPLYRYRGGDATVEAMLDEVARLRASQPRHDFDETLIRGENRR